MPYNDAGRHAAMVEFMSTFSTYSGSNPLVNITDLSDGVVIFEALSEIAPDYFDPTTIARHLGDNWALKSSNLRKLLRNLESFYHNSLQKDADFSSINVQQIARESSPDQIASLVELVAAAAVTCEDKGTYVSRIMKMTPESQVEMKGILESCLDRLQDFDADEEDGDENELVFGAPNDESAKEGDDDVEDRAESDLFGASHLRQSQQNQDDLEAALQEARRELSAFKSQASIMTEDHEKAQAKLRALVEDLQDRLVKRQDELAQVEEELKHTQEELDEHRAKLAEALAEKARLADDLDVANAKAQQLHKAEATVVAYKKKLEGVGVMNQQMTDLEDQAANYVRQIMELEAEVKKSAALQKTVSALQEHIAKLEKSKSDIASTSKSTSQEIADLRQRLQAAESAKKLYEEEIAELRAQQQHNAVHEEVQIAASAESAQSAFEQREKMTRLRVENEQLQAQVEALQKKLVAAEATPPPVVVAVSADESNELSSLKEAYNKLKEELELKERENAKIASDKDKLEAYTKRTLAKFQDKYLVALQECKAKLKEKQDKIDALESRSQSERVAQKREERLMSSTIYELGLAIMQNRLKER